jgi:hypothetical protein
MFIRTSSRTGSVSYEISGEPRLVDGEDGQTYVEITLENVRGKGQAASLMLTLEEIDELAAARRKLAKKR